MRGEREYSLVGHCLVEGRSDHLGEGMTQSSGVAMGYHVLWRRDHSRAGLEI